MTLSIIISLLLLPLPIYYLVAFIRGGGKNGFSGFDCAFCLITAGFELFGYVFAWTLLGSGWLLEGIVLLVILPFAALGVAIFIRLNIFPLSKRGSSAAMSKHERALHGAKRLIITAFVGTVIGIGLVAAMIRVSMPTLSLIHSTVEIMGYLLNPLYMAIMVFVTFGLWLLVYPIMLLALGVNLIPIAGVIFTLIASGIPLLCMLVCFINGYIRAAVLTGKGAGEKVLFAFMLLLPVVNVIFAVLMLVRIERELKALPVKTAAVEAVIPAEAVIPVEAESKDTIDSIQ